MYFIHDYERDEEDVDEEKKGDRWKQEGTIHSLCWIRRKLLRRNIENQAKKREIRKTILICLKNKLSVKNKLLFHLFFWLFVCF